MMHYGKTAFSIDGSDTIVPLKPLNGQVMGQRLRMSENDIQRINMMYCIEEPTTTVTSTQTPSTVTTTQMPVTSSTTSRPETPPPSNPGGQIIRVVINFVTNLINGIFRNMRPQ